MYLRLLNGEENHAKEVAGRLKEKENMIYEKINTTTTTTPKALFA